MKRCDLTRRLSRSLQRRLDRRCDRVSARRLDGARPVNHLGQALMALNRAARAHERLIKLAPEQFDFAVVERLAREREARARIHAEAKAALAKIYGDSPESAEEEMHRSQTENGGNNGAETVQFFGRTRRRELAIERWMNEWEMWMTLGRVAMNRHQTQQPHRRLSLGTVARMLELASTGSIGHRSWPIRWPPERPPPPIRLEMKPSSEHRSGRTKERTKRAGSFGSFSPL